LTAIGAADWDGTDGRYQAYDAGGDGAGPLSRGVDQHRHHDKASDGIPHTVLFGRDEALRIDEVAPVLARPRPMLTLASDVGDGNDLVRPGITCAHVLPFTYTRRRVDRFLGLQRDRPDGHHQATPQPQYVCPT
jgi:hypothetical protein